MANLIELIVSVVGADKASVDIGKLNQALSLTSEFDWKPWGPWEQAIAKTGNAAAEAAPKLRSVHESLKDLSAGIRDSLTPHLDSTLKQMLALAATAATFRTAYNGVKEAIAGGAEYQRLSLRLGESVREIVIQEQAFRNAGLSASYLATASNLLDRALSPLNQNAKRNKEVFDELGISMNALRMQSFGEQLQTLSAAFSKLPDQAARTEAAMQLFGRYAGGQMLQILSDPESLDLAKNQAGEFADEMQRVSVEMNNLQRDLSVVNLKFRELWLGVAETLLPAIREISQLMGGMNFIGLGQVLGFTAPVAAGGLLAMWGFDKLDLKMLSIAERFKKSVVGSTLQWSTKITGGLAEMMPPVLAAAIAGAVVSGVVQAMADSSLRNALDRAAWVGRQRHSAWELVTSVSSTDDARKNAALLEQQIVATQAEISKLEVKKGHAFGTPKYTGFASVGTAMAPGGAAYVGPNPLGWSDDQENHLADLKNVLSGLLADVSKLGDPSKISQTIEENRARALKASLAPVVQQLPELQKRIAQLQFTALTPAQQQASLNSQLATVQLEKASMPAQLAGTPEGAVYQAQREKEILEIKRQQEELQKRIADDAKRTAEESKRAAQEQARFAVLGLQAQQKEAEAAGNAVLVQQLKGEIELRQAEAQYSGQALALVERRIAAEDRLAAIQRERDGAKKAVEDEKNALEKRLGTIRENLANIEADFRKTNAEKWEARRQELLAEIGALQASQAADRRAEALATDPAAKAIWQKSASDTGDKIGSAQSQLSRLGPSPTNFGDQISAQFTKLRSAWTNTAVSLAQGIATVTGSIGTGLSNGLFDVFEHRVRTLGQFVGTVWTSIGQSAARMISDMAAKWIMEHTVMAAWSKIFHAQEVGTQAASTSAQVAIHAGGEAMKTGASAAGTGARTGISLAETVFHGLQVAIRVSVHAAGELAKTAMTMLHAGLRIATVIAESMAQVVLAAVGAMSAVASIPYVGPFLAVAAMAGILAAGFALVRGISKGFKVGGYTGSGSDGEEAGTVHANEYVFSAPAVRALGLGTLDTLHASALRGGYVSAMPSLGGGDAQAFHSAARGSGMPNLGAAAAAGSAGGSRPISTTVNAHFYMDRSAFARSMVQDNEGQFFDLMDMWARKRR